MMRSGAIKGAEPFFSGREPHVPAIQSYPTPKQIYLHVTPPTGNSEEAKTYHVISLERRPSSPNSDTTQSPYCSRCRSILFIPFMIKITLAFSALNTTRIIRFVIG